jgi:hypothetical protein
MRNEKGLLLSHLKFFISHSSLFSVFVSNPSYRMKIAWIAAVVLKVFSKIQYEIIDGAGGRINIVTPYGL